VDLRRPEAVVAQDAVRRVEFADGGQQPLGIKARSFVGAVGEHLEVGKQAEERRQQSDTAIAILNVVGGGDDAVQQQSLRVDQKCRFLPLISLPASKPGGSMRGPLFLRSSRSDCR
jgi:hypothetical protein